MSSLARRIACLALLTAVASCGESGDSAVGETVPAMPQPSTTAAPSSAAPSSSPTVATTTAGRIATDWAAEHDVVGAVVAVYDANGAVERTTLGWQNRELGIATDAASPYRIGSITKVFTAALVLDLAEDDILALDDPADRFIPEADPAITVGDLLAHTSGVRDVDVAAGIAELFANGADVPTPENTLIESLAGDLAFTPGSKQSYSSVGYLALELIVAEATGQDYETLLSSRILEPLGLTSVAIESEAIPLPVGYERLGPGSPAISLASIRTTEFARGAGGAGALVATADEVAQFIRALFSAQVLAPDSFLAMQSVTPPRVDYGLGLSQYRVGSEVLWGHNGRTIGFASSVRHDPDTGVTVVVLSNDGAAPTDELAEEIIMALP